MKTLSPSHRGHLRHRSFRGRHGQQGVVMFVAMVVLIVMTLAGLAMLRQMGSSVSIAGNMALKQGATAIADVGIETARQWMTTSAALNPTVLNHDDAAHGYYSSWGTDAGAIDPTSAAWATWWSAAPVTHDSVTGNDIRYVIQRLCLTKDLSSNAAGQQCSDVGTSDNPGESKGGASGPAFTQLTAPFYRITAQVKGPRSTVSYTQIVMN